MSGAAPAAGLQAPGLRVSVVKSKASGWWRITVALPSGAHAVSEHPTWDGAWEKRHELHDLLTKDLPPVRGDAMHGPLGRVTGGVG